MSNLPLLPKAQIGPMDSLLAAAGCRMSGFYMYISLIF